jgi:cytochrome oxidase Cu insertion factor (SCO1/SenC/PrrC family)
MGRMKRHLMLLFLRRPVLVGTVSALLVVGIGLAGATPWLEWWQATPAPDGTAFALQRAFAEEASTVMPRTVSDFALTDLTGRQVGLREQVGKVILVNFITTRCATACDQVTRELQGL